MARNENLDKVVYSTQVLAWCEKPHWETRCSRAGHHRRLLGSKKIIFPPFLWPCLACCYFLQASRCFPPSAGAQPGSSPPAASVFETIFESSQHKSDKSSSACGETLGWGWWRQFRHVLGDPLGQAYRGWCWGKFISCRSGNHLDFAVGMDNEVSLSLRGAVSTGWKILVSPQIHRFLGRFRHNRTDFVGDFVLLGFVWGGWFLPVHKISGAKTQHEVFFDFDQILTLLIKKNKLSCTASSVCKAFVISKHNRR